VCGGGFIGEGITNGELGLFIQFTFEVLWFGLDRKHQQCGMGLNYRDKS
jgi:hypothetical protein